MNCIQRGLFLNLAIYRSILNQHTNHWLFLPCLIHSPPPSSTSWHPHLHLHFHRPSLLLPQRRDPGSLSQPHSPLPPRLQRRYRSTSGTTLIDWSFAPCRLHNPTGVHHRPAPAALQCRLSLWGSGPLPCAGPMHTAKSLLPMVMTATTVCYPAARPRPELLLDPQVTN